jgi:methyl-accepting chemotaxis protein
MLARWSIRSKVITVIGFLLVFLSGLGTMAVLSMQYMNAHTLAIANKSLPSTRELGVLLADVNAYRVSMRDLLLGETVEERAAAEKRLTEKLERLETHRKNYEALISSSEERVVYSEWFRIWKEYLQGVDELIEASRKVGGRSTLDARNLFQTKYVKLGSEADQLINKAIDLNKIRADIETKAAADNYSTAFNVILGCIAATMLGGALLGYLIVRDLSSGIASIIKPMQELAQGDLRAEVTHRGERTEVGAMADSLQIFKEALISKKATDEAAARDTEAKIERGRRVDSITRGFESMIGDIVERLSSTATELESSSGTLTATAERAQQVTTAVAAASEEASTNVQSVASATEELSSSVNEISRQVQVSARMAGEAVDQARKTNDRVGELSRAAGSIGDVVELINTIASQTNLLALNATIEAARAGEAGRGFAVVASEVKALAEQTAKATDEISQHISGIQAATQESVGAIKEIGGTIERLSEIASTIAAAVEQQGAATQEISRNVQQAAHGTQGVSSNIVDVQRGTAETNSASAYVLTAAKSLAGDSTRLKVEVNNFLKSVRAA